MIVGIVTLLVIVVGSVFWPTSYSGGGTRL
jgi:hypothetical protein